MLTAPTVENLRRVREKSRTKGAIPSFVYNGIDRVDNSVGYVLSNCVPCCSTCNRMKGTMSSEEFKEKIKLIYSRQNQ